MPNFKKNTGFKLGSRRAEPNKRPLLYFNDKEEVSPGTPLYRKKLDGGIQAEANDAGLSTMTTQASIGNLAEQQAQQQAQPQQPQAQQGQPQQGGPPQQGGQPAMDEGQLDQVLAQLPPELKQAVAQAIQQGADPQVALNEAMAAMQSGATQQ